MDKLKKEFEENLEPFSIVLAGVVASLESKEDEELLQLFDASCFVSETNCWWATYQVAQILRPKIEEIFRERAVTVYEIRNRNNAK